MRLNLRTFIRPVASKMVDWLLRVYYTRAFLQSPKLSQEHETTISDLEEVLARASSLEDFLGQPELQEEYYRVLRAFFRKRRLHRAGYLKIMEQLKSFPPEAINLREALWAGPPAVSFLVQSTSPTYGRGVLLDVWRVYRTQWLEGLRSHCQLDVDQRDFTDAEAQLSRVLAGLAQKIEAFEKLQAGVIKKKRLAETGKFYAALKSDAEITRAASFLLYRFLIAEKSTYLFDSDNADMIVEFFKSLSQNTSGILPAQLRGETPKFLAWRIKSLIPGVQELLSDTVMLPRLYRTTSNGKSVLVGSSGTSDYLSQSVRPFHGIWTGIIHQDCLGGEITNLKDLTPRRWAIGGLAGVLTLFLLRDGAYQGVIRLVPMVGPGHRHVVSIDACAPVLGAQVHVEGPKTLFEAWFEKFIHGVPDSMRCVVFSESTDGDLAQVKSAIWNSACYREGQDVGDASQFRFTDPKAEQYLRTLVLTLGIQAHGSSFVTDATLRDSGKLRLLKFAPHRVS